MYNNTLLSVLLLLTVATFASGKYIASITTDKPSGQIFVLEYDSNPILYELDNVAVTQNNAHYVKDQSNPANTADTNSFFIRKKGAQQRVLHAAFDTDAGLTVNTFKLPIGNQQTLPYIDTGVVGSLGASLDPSFDTASPYAIFNPSRNLSLVNLNTLDIQDTMRYWGNRIFGRNVVYNNNNKRVIVFYTAAKIYPAPYGLSVEEFDVSTNKFVESTTTYNCECATNPSASPFFKIVFDEAKCRLNYPTNTIWCSNSENSKLFSFQADDLTKYKVYKVAANYSNVAWDFPNNRVYALQEKASGFAVHKINLSNGNVIASKSVANVAIDSFVSVVDSDQPHLYIAVFGDGTSPTTIVSVNTDTLAATTVALSPAGL